ncbi:photosystem II stability/assembly factor-like uncharacterized protein [Chitinophaga skermanii]|uniref:Photosystem II stability/assembly factor-like uncharacterized protein n=1 Tax=Chitinophaga skermanii TaxID=331697 RepID=A0A327R370_9BACT|nr:YCF48-related protein [Chitinophaga skermanii]RAJ11160.1 photosystem II stability/assembly factor-like uncharacterized protein [Chitinophaga skermanii]
MKMKLNLTLVVVLCTTIFACRKDKETPSTTKDYSIEWSLVKFPILVSSISQVNFFDDYNGYVVGRSETMDTTYLLRTTDGGKSWTYQSIDNKLFRDASGGSFPGNIGIPSPTSNLVLAAAAAFMASNDGGLSWKQAGNSSINILNPQLGSFVFMQNENVIFYTSQLYKSKDGGQNFKSTSDNYRMPFRIVKMKGNTGFAISGDEFDATNYSIILKTTDGGDSWKVANHPDAMSRNITSLFMLNENIAYVAVSLYNGNIGGTISNGGALYKTTNGGQTWFPIETDGQNQWKTQLYSLYFFDEMRGLAIHGRGIYYTYDGGKTWQDEGLLKNSRENYDWNMTTTSKATFVVVEGNKLYKRTY